MKRMVVLVLAIALLVAGCGQQGTENKGSGTNENAETTTDNGNEATATSGETVKLKLFIPQPRFREQYESYIDRFCEKYKEETGITVEYDIEMPSADTASEILKTRLSTGDDLDVYMFHASNERAQYYKAGYLEDLSDQPWVDSLYESTRSAVTYEGKVVGLPIESLTWGILYNKDMFDELDLKPAMTLSELEANSQAIKDAGKTPFLASYNEAWIPQLLLPLTVGAYENSVNEGFIERMYAGETSFSEIEGMFDVIDLVHANANEDGLEIGGIDGCAEFATGNYGMWVQGPWYSANILEANPDMNFGVAPLPINDDEASTMVNAGVSTTLGVSTFSQHKDIAKALVAYFLDPDDSEIFFTSCQFSPVSDIHNYETYPWIEEATSYVEQGKSYLDPSMPQAVKDEAGKTFQSYYSKIVNKNDVIEALDESWKVFNQINN